MRNRARIKGKDNYMKYEDVLGFFKCQGLYARIHIKHSYLGEREMEGKRGKRG